MNGSPIAAPSAAPVTAAPVIPAATTPPAPGAAALPTPSPLTLEYYDRLASVSLQANSEPAPASPAPVTDPAALESPAATAETATTEVPAENATPVQTPGPENEDPEPTVEELAALGDPGKRALQAERDKRKAAMAENKELKDRLAAIEAKLNTPPAPATTPAAVTPPPTPSVPTGLTQCESPEAVDAVAMNAVATEATVLKLQATLTRNGLAAVIPLLKANGVTAIEGVPVEEAGEEAVSTLLVNAGEGAKMTQLQAPQRKAFLDGRAQSFNRAVAVLPNLVVQGTPENTAAVRILQSEPSLRGRADWPEIVTRQILGDRAMTAAAKPAGKPTVPAEVQNPKPNVTSPKPAPGAPRTSAAALPVANELDGLRAKLKAGTATEKDVDRYSVLSVRGG